jgi:cobalt-precorrin 5A hydrolase
MNNLAIVALTPTGLELGRRLAAALGQGEVLMVRQNMRSTLEELFFDRRPMVCVMALGIVVRILGPLTKHKEGDPAVVVIDEAGTFVISVLGGHSARANALADQVAQAIGAIPVITTASDALGLPAVDLIGQEFGWKVESRENLTKVAAAVVRGEAIAVYQDAGRRDWWHSFGEWPKNFSQIDAWPPVGQWRAGVVISDRLTLTTDAFPILIYRPPTLFLGVGCRRGTRCEEIETMFQSFFQSCSLSPLSLAAVATATLKANEPGLQEFATRHEVPLRCFPLEELAEVHSLPTPSEMVRTKIGIAGVAEPAAMLAAGTASLLIPKIKGPGITMAVARAQGAAHEVSGE